MKKTLLTAFALSLLASTAFAGSATFGCDRPEFANAHPKACSSNDGDRKEARAPRDAPDDDDDDNDNDDDDDSDDDDDGNNGHGNDDDHDDDSNPGQGHGNHGA